MGVDADQLLLILSVKNQVSQRTPLRLTPLKNSRKAVSNNLLSRVLKMIAGNFMPALFGLMFLIYTIAARQYPYTGLFVTVGMLFMMSAMLMIIEFAKQIVDTDEQTILGSRPVKPQTLLLARSLFLLSRFLRYNIPMALPLLIYMIARYNTITGLFCFALLLFGFILIFSGVLLFIVLLLNILPANFFKRMVPWLQGAMLVMVYFTIFGAGKVNFLQEDIFILMKHSASRFFLPNYWLVAILYRQVPVLYSLLYCALPLFLFFIAIRWLSGIFFRKIDYINSGATRVAFPVSFRRKKSTRAPFHLLFRKAPQQKAAFQFSKKFMSRDNAFRMTVLPNYIYIIFINYNLFYGIWQYITGAITEIKDSVIIMAFYVLLYPVTLAIGSLQISGDYRAAWIFAATPLKNKGPIYQGMAAALFQKVYLIIALPLAFIVLLLKPSVWLNILLAMATCWMIVSLIALTMFTEPVASMPKPETRPNSGKRIFLLLFVFIVALLLGGIHIYVLAKTFWWVQVTLLLIIFAASYLIWDKLGRKQ
jgi:hypothetical protein